MRLDVTFRNLEPSEAIKERAEKKFHRIDKHLREPIEAHLVLAVQGYRHVAELTITAPGEHIRLQEESDDMYATLDQLAQRVDRVVQRHHEKAIARAHTSSLLPEIDQPEAAQPANVLPVIPPAGAADETP